jgi:hypothetical protein
VRLKRRKVLGLALDERSIVAAEVRLTSGGREVKRAAEFVFPAESSLQDPAALGSALGQFLRQNGFSARHAVVGLPAKWLMVRQEDVPAVSAESLAGMLMIQAERAFSLDVSDLALDCAGPVGVLQGGKVLLVAALRKALDQVMTAMRAARVKVLGVGSTAMTLAWAAGQSDSAPSVVLYMGPNTAELAVRAGGTIRLLRHVPAGASAAGRPDAAAVEHRLALTAEEMRRVISLLPGLGAAQPGDVTVWDGAGLDADALVGLVKDLGLPARQPEDLSPLGLSASVEQPCRFAAAAALGAAGLKPGLLPVDFMHSRLAVRRRSPLRRTVAWAAAVGGACVLAGLFLAFDLGTRTHDVEELKQKLEAMKPDIEAARSLVERVSTARGWYDRRPEFLDCLLDLDLAFPEEGSVWASTLVLKEDMRGIVSGKAVNEQVALQVMDNLMASPAFKDVKPIQMGESRGSSREVSFSLSFLYVGAG